MFPFRDESPTTVFAWVTLVFIATNLFAMAIWFGAQFSFTFPIKTSASLQA
jgi:hypothetical protein